MAASGLIAAYLTELRYSAAGLPDLDDVVAEAEDHLLTTVEAMIAAGMRRPDAEAEALARFGSAALVANVLAEEAKRGGAVSTRVTRRAGAAAMLVPVLLVVGETGNQLIANGALHGAAVSLLGVGLIAFAVAVWGIRRRHGGLGRWGQAAVWLFAASPFIAAPFAWGAGVAFLFVQLIVLTLLGIGMLKARILPRSAVALFTFSPAATLALSSAVSAAFADAAHDPLPAGIALSAVGLAWVGSAMWREPALDVRQGAGSGPLTA